MLAPEEVESNKTSSFKARYDKNEARRRIEEGTNIYTWEYVFEVIFFFPGHKCKL